MLQQTLNSIQPLNERAMAAARQHLDQIAKPPGSLGKMEDLLVQIAGIAGLDESTINIEKRALEIFCADNGVVEEGVTANPPEITAIMAEHFLKRQTSVTYMCRETGTATAVSGDRDSQRRYEKELSR